MRRIEGDICKKPLRHIDTYIAEIRRVGGFSGKRYDLCERCAHDAKVAISKLLVERAKDTE